MSKIEKGRVSRRVAIYLRVSRTEQTTTNQRREPYVVACTHSWLAFNASWIALQSTQSHTF
jgi:hypothetical protein